MELANNRIIFHMMQTLLNCCDADHICGFLCSCASIRIGKQHVLYILQIDEHKLGTEIAAETSVVVAAASIVFSKTDKAYARQLLNKAKSLFRFAGSLKGTFDGECPFYCSLSGSNDENQTYYHYRRSVC
ncbi:hypothetical protein SOVF_027530 [Spinacia oleracea]|nr:hypothetical protein SOVF_027530 [Spinacia oleracea]